MTEEIALDVVGLLGPLDLLDVAHGTTTEYRPDASGVIEQKEPRRKLTVTDRPSRSTVKIFPRSFVALSMTIAPTSG
jgi:hypothetical protein